MTAVDLWYQKENWFCGIKSCISVRGTIKSIKVTAVDLWYQKEHWICGIKSYKVTAVYLYVAP